MPPEKPDAGFIWDMLESAITVQKFSEGHTFDDYLNNRMLRSAIEREIEIIGEAARHVSQVYQAAHPHVPWRIIIAQRHVLAHEYGEIKHERIWRVVKQHLPLLIEQLKPLAAPPPTLPETST